MKLKGEIWNMKDVTKKQKDCMFSLFKRYYDDVNYKLFMRDLSEKQWVLLLFDEDKLIKGFSTLMLLNTLHNRKKVYAIFSGDTIIDKTYWGKHNFYEVWIDFSLNLAKKYDELYWFLISKGYKTYRIMPRFFKRFYPRYDEQTPKRIKALIDKFAYLKFPKDYDGKNIIHFNGHTDKLSKKYADIPKERLKNPHINFFLKSNPNYAQGDNLVCLARISKDNYKLNLKMIEGYIKLKRFFSNA